MWVCTSERSSCSKQRYETKALMHANASLVHQKGAGNFDVTLVLHDRRATHGMSGLRLLQ